MQISVQSIAVRARGISNS